MAAHLAQWRQDEGLTSFKMKSCWVALYIWTQTCLKVLHLIREQQDGTAVEPQRPEFLIVSAAKASRFRARRLSGALPGPLPP
jgi:hypothetical protein